MVEGTSDIDRACYRNIRLSTLCPECDLRGVWVISVVVFQRFLEGSNIHVNLVIFNRGHFSLSGHSFGQAVFGQAVLKSLHLHASICAHQGDAVPKFVIEREVPGAGNLSEAQLCELSQKSVNVLKAMGPAIQWLHSYVTGDKVYCVYLAPDDAAIREHARRVGIPANRVSAVRRLIDPTSAA
jgi:hypothetical protein